MLFCGSVRGRAPVNGYPGPKVARTLVPGGNTFLILIFAVASTADAVVVRGSATGDTVTLVPERLQSFFGNGPLNASGTGMIAPARSNVSERISRKLDIRSSVPRQANAGLRINGCARTPDGAIARSTPGTRTPTPAA